MGEGGLAQAGRSSINKCPPDSSATNASRTSCALPNSSELTWSCARRSDWRSASVSISVERSGVDITIP